MKQYLLTPTGCEEAAKGWGIPLGILGWTIAGGPPGAHLTHGEGARSSRGALMVMGVSQAPQSPGGVPGLVQEILGLCERQGFQGVVLDLEEGPSPFVDALVRQLDRALARHHRGLFLPEAFANYSDRALLYLSSAVSGGSLEGRLEEAVARYGAHRLALSLHRAREDFYLPSPEGRGRAISREEFRRLADRLDPTIHFSPHLCARYFTYMSRETGAHLVLFDDAETLGRKREIALSLGIERFLWVWQEVEDLGPELLR